MKKLMIAAAAATMVGGAFAAEEAQVYDFSASLKTTSCKEVKVSSAMEKYFAHKTFGASSVGAYEKGEKIGVRKQLTVKLGGVIWNCWCPTISMPGWRYTRPGSKFIGGYLFWNEKVNELYNPLETTFKWFALNRIDTMTKCEGTFRLRNNDTLNGQALFLVGSGFGTVSGTGCDTYLKSISGNLAGIRMPSNDEFGCIYCDAEGCVVAPFCDTCIDRDTRDLSAAYGSWKIKYNKSASKKLAANGFLSRVYSFGKKAGDAKEFLNVVERWAYANAAADADTGDVILPAEYDDLDDDKKSDAKLKAFLDNIAEVAETEPLDALNEWIEGLLGEEDYADELPLWLRAEEFFDEDSAFAQAMADLS